MAGEHGIFEVLGNYLLEPGEAEYTEEINLAKATGGLVFVLLTDPETTAVLLVQGAKMGLFGIGKSVFCHDYAIDPETVSLIQALDNRTDPDVYLKGVIGFKADPLYPVVAFPTGQQFLRR